MKTNRFTRRCSVTGKGINAGWYIDGEWFSTQELAEDYAKLQGYKNYEEMYLAYNFDEYGNELESSHGDCYWTEFEDVEGEIESSGEYYTADGNLIEL